MKKKINNLNIDLIYQILIFISCFVVLINSKFYNVTFIISLILLYFKLKNNKVSINKLDLIAFIVLITFFISYISEGKYHFKIYFQFLKMIMLFLIGLRFKLIRINSFILYYFTIVSLYGLLRLTLNPMYLVGSIRAYPYLNYIMDSSVVSMMNYTYGLLIIFKGNKKEKIFGVLIVTLSIWMIILASVRATFVSFVLITLIILIDTLKNNVNFKKNFIFLIIFFFFLFFSFKQVPQNLKIQTFDRVKSIIDVEENKSNIYRIKLWKEAKGEFVKNPFIMKGYGNYREIEIQDQNNKIILWHAHNEYLVLLIEIGIFGLAIWFIFKLYLLYLFYRKRDNILYYFGILIIINLEVHNIFDIYINRRGLYVYTFMILGILLVSDSGFIKSNKLNRKESYD